jgi:hypothetical protein
MEFCIWHDLIISLKHLNVQYNANNFVIILDSLMLNFTVAGFTCYFSWFKINNSTHNLFK